MVYTPQATDSDALLTAWWSDADKFVINGDGSVSFVTADFLGSWIGCWHEQLQFLGTV